MHVQRAVLAVILCRGRGLPPTHQDTGFGEAAETAVIAVLMSFHSDRWQQPLLPIERRKLNLRTSSSSNYAKATGAKAIEFLWSRMYSLVKHFDWVSACSAGARTSLLKSVH
uniref:Putative secreted protein n=1 Tax=Ixodes ricinus TaxID=34613 RepID=A0A6B0UJS0_IXORI